MEHIYGQVFYWFSANDLNSPYFPVQHFKCNSSELPVTFIIILTATPYVMLWYGGFFCNSSIMTSIAILKHLQGTFVFVCDFGGSCVSQKEDYIHMRTTEAPEMFCWLRNFIHPDRYVMRPYVVSRCAKYTLASPTNTLNLPFSVSGRYTTLV